ncbi:MAG: glycosyltransferase [Umezawaea sp.]
MRILLVSGIRPWDPFGGALRTGQIARSLAETGEVDLLVMPLDRNHGAGPPTGLFGDVTIVEQEYSMLDTRRSTVRTLDETLRGVPAAQIHRMRKVLAARAAEVLGRRPYDLVWYMREHVWLMTRGIVRARTVVDVDDFRDVVLERWRTLGLTEQGTPLTWQARLRMTREINWWRRTHPVVEKGADRLIVSSEVDRRRLASDKAMVIPNTYALRQESRAAGDRDNARPPTILFQGILRWGPNADAVHRLVHDIAPLVRAQVPDVRILLVGKVNERIERYAEQPGVEVTGQVPEMAPYLCQTDVIAVPLRIGGGTRIKILEAFAHHVPVVSSTIGAEGIDAVPGTHLYIEDSDERFAQRCVTLLKDQQAAREMAERAHALYTARHRPEHCSEAVRQVVGSVVAGVSADD